MKLPEGFFSSGDMANYRDLFSRVPRGGLTVELGTWLGRSLCSCAEIIRYREIRVVGVELFCGEPDHAVQTAAVNSGRDLERELRANLDAWGLRQQVAVLRADTLKAHELFADETFDLVFWDALKQNVAKDVRAWWPKVKPGGRIAGHDYTKWGGLGGERPGTMAQVKRDLDELFGDRIRKTPKAPRSTVWEVTK